MKKFLTITGAVLCVFFLGYKTNEHLKRYEDDEL